MLIQVHAIQNHSAANLNRDDLGAPKTCYFGGVLRSRISSQCLKRSIRMSAEFEPLRGGVRTRQLAKMIAAEIDGNAKNVERAERVLEKCGIRQKTTKKASSDEDGESSRSKMLVYTTRKSIRIMAETMVSDSTASDDQIARKFAEIISKHSTAPDMALSGRMLETGVIKDTTVEAALQVAHAFSTHEARPEVDYYVAADDEPGDDAGAGYVDEAVFSSACFYKYFAINTDTLTKNLGGEAELAARTVG
ncbi:MAG: type I-E CRISPR-associated protein Cas7/Cse4/CasC [SAR202 cluster bacterium]|nr:type I-E CRISPR-associated protein Cas7/Cse4/CasC [SAR202 cluster bacterium]